MHSDHIGKTRGMLATTFDVVKIAKKKLHTLNVMALTWLPSAILKLPRGSHASDFDQLTHLLDTISPCSF
jgi:hypothetical protein